MTGGVCDVIPTQLWCSDTCYLFPPQTERHHRRRTRELCGTHMVVVSLVWPWSDRSVLNAIEIQTEATWITSLSSHALSSSLSRTTA